MEEVLKKNIPFFLILLMLIQGAYPVWATSSDGKKSSAPIHIEADRMESEQNNNKVLFLGNVEAKQEDLFIRSDKMTVYYKKEGDSETKDGTIDASKSIEKLLAVGHVEIVRAGWAANGDNVEYFSEERKVVLTGNTRVWQDNNMVTGEKITLFLDEGKSIVENKGQTNGGRVKAFFYPDSAPE